MSVITSEAAEKVRKAPWHSAENAPAFRTNLPDVSNQTPRRFRTVQTSGD